MNKQQEALKLALEALETLMLERGSIYDKAITAIREALADSALDRMADNARELGLDYAPIVEQVEDFVGMGHKAWDMVDPKELAKGFHEALAEPPCKTGSQCTSKCQQCEQPAQQEPLKPKFVRNVDGVPCITLVEHEHLMRFRTSPPASPTQSDIKPWVGLTDEDVTWLCNTAKSHEQTWGMFVRAIEAKLRELNEYREKNA